MPRLQISRCGLAPSRAGGTRRVAKRSTGWAAATPRADEGAANSAAFAQRAPPTGAATSALRALSNPAIPHETFAAALLPSDATQGQSYNSHSCSTLQCRRAFIPRTRHRECTHHTQPARHPRDLKSSITDREPAVLTRAMWSQPVCVRAQNGQRSARSPAALVVAYSFKSRRLSGSLFHRRANQRPRILVAPQQRTA